MSLLLSLPPRCESIYPDWTFQPNPPPPKIPNPKTQLQQVQRPQLPRKDPPPPNPQRRLLYRVVPNLVIVIINVVTQKLCPLRKWNIWNRAFMNFSSLAVSLKTVHPSKERRRSLAFVWYHSFYNTSHFILAFTSSHSYCRRMQKKSYICSMLHVLEICYGFLFIEILLKWNKEVIYFSWLVYLSIIISRKTLVLNTKMINICWNLCVIIIVIV